MSSTQPLPAAPATPLVSIVVPTYNRWPRLRDTIRGLREQQAAASFEIIVVDDGSTDGTKAGLASLSDPAIRYHWQPNRERGAARNAGAALARGKYCNFFDSDDLCYSNHVAEAAKLISRQDEPPVFHLGYEIREENGRLRGRFRRGGLLNRHLLRGNCLSCDGVFVRTDVARALPFSEDPRLSATEDWLLWLRLASRHPMLGSPVVTSAIVQHPERSVMKADEAALVARRDLLVENLRHDSAFMRWRGRCLRSIRAQMTLYVALHLVLAGQSRTGLYYLVGALWEDPRLCLSRRTGGTLKHLALNYLRERWRPRQGGERAGC